ncbi:hypothetical protein CRN84_11610 [Budvicia aquatica]|uniref:Uncharacterized protein n=1 Tax=Budvicia aquatica TaxID=82979 RepID=A0A2C6DFH1_9GAMM|nr:hypothetical protein CRN84_11610 [Budvicia aquatica]
MVIVGILKTGKALYIFYKIYKEENIELDENSDINSFIVTMYSSDWSHHEISEFTRLIIWQDKS